jgi:predicted HicB family RNase H-like nuclease
MNEEEWNTLEEIAKFLNQFVSHEKGPRYSYIDRLAAAYDPKIVEITMQEALREARSANFWVPAIESVKKFIELCNKDLKYSIRTSALALAYRSKGGAT